MLEGMKILSFVHGLYGCSASQMLADLGAEVVRIEWDMSGRRRPGSDLDDGDDWFFRLTGRNQKSVALNPGSEEGREVLRRLLETYDIVLENCPGGMLEKWGIGYEQLRRICPRLIWCSCRERRGEAGRRPDMEEENRRPGVEEEGCRPGVDDELILESVTGLASLNGPGSKPPVPAGTALIEQHAAVLMALGITAAARDRERTGQGHLVETSLFSASLDMQIETIGYYLNGGRFIERADTGLSTRIHQSPYGVYHTADGYITLSLTHHDRLCRIFSPGVMDVFTEQDAMDQRVLFDRTVSRELRKKTTAQWMEMFENMKDMWFAPVNEYDQVMEDEQLIHNDPFVTLGTHKGRPVRGLGHANCYDGRHPQVRVLPPEFGQHTREILGGIGYDCEELDQLEKTGTINRNNQQEL